MRLRTSEDNRRKLTTAYNELLNIRKKAIGLVVEDPNICDSSIETKNGITRLDERYNELQSSPIGLARLRDRLGSVFKKDPDALVKTLIYDVENVKLKYSRKTLFRSKYGILCPIAFRSEHDLPSILGAPRSNRTFALTWCARFQQLNSEQTDAGILEVIGITSSGLMQWWSNDHPDHGKEETRVWSDLKTLALKLVCVFDKTALDDSSRSSSFMALVSDASSQARIKEICMRLKKLAISLFRLLYLRHEYFNDILPLYELLVPVTYALSVLLGVDNWTSMGIQATSVLESYLTIMDALRDALITHLGAYDEMKIYETSDNILSSAPCLYTANSNATLVGNESMKAFTLRQEAVNELEAIGLIEVNLDLTRGERVGSGSFSNVSKYPAENGAEEFAVKFFKCKKSDLERTKNRLLREAKHWVGLSHKNINTLHGICIHPEEELPGLVSTLCNYTLDDYLDRSMDEKEKLGYLFEIAEGLEYMHQVKHLAHGDLRPPNILLAPGAFGCGLMAKLNDFGVSDSKVRRDGYKLTSMQHTNDIYLAPELMPAKKSAIPDLRGVKKPTGPCQVSLPGDIYAFGCVFLEVLYDKRPFYYDTTGFVKLKRGGRLPALQEDIQSQHWEFLARTWDSKADRRPSAKDLVDQILIFMT